MRTALGTALLLASTALVSVAAPVHAAGACAEGSADTTWVGPATQSGTDSWADPANWTDGVPGPSSTVCIPATAPTPRIPWGVESVGDVIDATGATVTIEGTLTVGTHLYIAVLEGGGGALHGPATATVTKGVTGDLSLQDAAAVALPLDAHLEGSLGVWNGSSLEVSGDVVVEGAARVDTLGWEEPGEFTITETGSLTLDSAGGRAEISGPFANYGEVHVAAGDLMVLGDGEEATHVAYSTGTFSEDPDGSLMLFYTELRTGAILDHLDFVGGVTVPAGHTVTASASRFLSDLERPELAASGGGELVATNGTDIGGRIGGSLTVTVPASEVAHVGGILQDETRVRVDGELVQDEHLRIEDDAVLDVYGVHRGAGHAVFSSSDDPGLEVIHPGGRLLGDEGGGLGVMVPFVNQGTVDSGPGGVYIGPAAASPTPSSGTFRGGTDGRLYLGGNGPGDPAFELDHAVVEGDVRVSGDVRADSALVSGQVSTAPVSEHQPFAGRVTLTGSSTMSDGASLTGHVVVAGRLESDPGPAGSATLDGAEVTGAVRAASGTLDVPSLSPRTLDLGVLRTGTWSAAPGALLDLHGVSSSLATVVLEGAGARLPLPGDFRNEGVLRVGSGSRLAVGGTFSQAPTGRLVTRVAKSGVGRVVAQGPRDLDGSLLVRRDTGYRPPLGTVRTVVVSDGSVGRGAGFDAVRSRPFGARRLAVRYASDRVNLRVVRVG